MWQSCLPSVRMRLLALLIFLLPSCVSACLWIHGTTLDGESRRASGFLVDRELRSVMEGHEPHLMDLRIIGDEMSKSEKEEDAAVEKVVNGDFAGAIADLERLEQHSPGK